MQLPEEIREFFRRQGKIGAVRRKAVLSSERRSEIAKQAAQTRWAKAKTKQAAKQKPKRGGDQ